MGSVSRVTSISKSLRIYGTSTHVSMGSVTHVNKFISHIQIWLVTHTRARMHARTHAHTHARTLYLCIFTTRWNDSNRTRFSRERVKLQIQMRHVSFPRKRTHMYECKRATHLHQIALTDYKRNIGVDGRSELPTNFCGHAPHRLRRREKVVDSPTRRQN